MNNPLQDYLNDLMTRTEKAMPKVSPEVWKCSRDYVPVRHFYIGRDGGNIPKCACGSDYLIEPQPNPVCRECGDPITGEAYNHTCGPCAQQLAREDSADREREWKEANR